MFEKTSFYLVLSSPSSLISILSFTYYHFFLLSYSFLFFDCAFYISSSPVCQPIGRCQLRRV